MTGMRLEQETLTTYRQLGAHGLSAAGTEPNEGTDNCLFKALPPEVQVSVGCFWCRLGFVLTGRRYC
jgi:hypothetical protein